MNLIRFLINIYSWWRFAFHGQNQTYCNSVSYQRKFVLLYQSVLIYIESLRRIHTQTHTYSSECIFFILKSSGKLNYNSIQNHMQTELENNHAAIVEDYQKPPSWKPYKLPELKDDQVLVKVQASTINPSDELTISGLSKAMTKLPFVGGKQGVGKVIKTGSNAKQFQNKRVCFSHFFGGAWSNYAISTTKFTFIIDEDVPVTSAASGIVNPLTVLGFISETKRRKQNSIIHTAAASSLGRMLNRICKSEGINLLNVVRRQEHADLLKSEGAEHIIVTTGEWEKEYIEKVKELKSKILFDALGGGEVQATLIKNHPNDGVVIVYGVLEGKDPSKPTCIPAANLISGLQLSGFILPRWYMTLSGDQINQIRKKYSLYLKNQLHSPHSKQFKLEQIAQALSYYKENASKGKVLLKP